MYTSHETEDVCCSHIKDCFHLVGLGEGLLRLRAGRALLVLPMRGSASTRALNATLTRGAPGGAWLHWFFPTAGQPRWSEVATLGRQTPDSLTPLLGSTVICWVSVPPSVKQNKTFPAGSRGICKVSALPVDTGERHAEARPRKQRLPGCPSQGCPSQGTARRSPCGACFACRAGKLLAPGSSKTP